MSAPSTSLESLLADDLIDVKRELTPALLQQLSFFRSAHLSTAALASLIQVLGHERRLLGRQPVGAHSGLQLGMRRAPTASVTRSSAAQLRAEPRELVRVERTARRAARATARLSGATAAGGLSRTRSAYL